MPQVALVKLTFVKKKKIIIIIIIKKVKK